MTWGLWTQSRCISLPVSVSVLTAIEPGLANFTKAKDDGSAGDNWSYKLCKALVKWSNRHHKQTNTQFLTGRMIFLSLNQQCQSAEGKSMDFLTPKLTWGLATLFLTTNSSRLPWRSSVMPVMSPLIPVLQLYHSDRDNSAQVYEPCLRL